MLEAQHPETNAGGHTAKTEDLRGGLFAQL